MPGSRFSTAAAIGSTTASISANANWNSARARGPAPGSPALERLEELAAPVAVAGSLEHTFVQP
jgi:hypothetical protein